MGHDDLDAETPQERQARHRDLSRERPEGARVQRSDDLEAMRSDRAEGLEDTRVTRAEKLAVANALRQERVDVRLNQHEQRLNAINGSVTKAADNLQRVDDRVGGLHKKFDAAATEQKTRDAVNVALIEASASKGARKLTSYQIFGIVAMALLAAASLIFAIIQAAGHP